MYNRLGEMDYVQRNSTECSEAVGKPSCIIWGGRWEQVKDLPYCDGLFHYNPVKCPVIVIFGNAKFLCFFTDGLFYLKMYPNCIVPKKTMFIICLVNQTQGVVCGKCVCTKG